MGAQDAPFIYARNLVTPSFVFPGLQSWRQNHFIYRTWQLHWIPRVNRKKVANLSEVQRVESWKGLFLPSVPKFAPMQPSLLLTNQTIKWKNKTKIWRERYHDWLTSKKNVAIKTPSRPYLSSILSSFCAQFGYISVTTKKVKFYCFLCRFGERSLVIKTPFCLLIFIFHLKISHYIHCCLEVESFTETLLLLMVF